VEWVTMPLSPDALALQGELCQGSVDSAHGAGEMIAENIGEVFSSGLGRAQGFAAT
jgi:hypothetical protein